MSSSLDRIRIGYAFPPNKEKAIIKPSLIDYAKLHGVDLIRIDLQLPLLHQLPLDCIIHKLYDDSWIHKLHEFTSKNPDVIIVDSPELISQLHDRVSMLQVVKEIKTPITNVKIKIPKQVAFYEPDGLASFSDLGLKFPVIAKPLKVDGSAKSHEMSLVFNKSGLKELATAVPVVLQEFVNHGGVLFKVYVAGEQAVCVERKSLLDVLETEEELEKMEGVMKFSQISRFEDKSNGGSDGEEKKVEIPPLEIVMEIARGLREGMGLRLFNFDMIRDENETYFVIDINYLPGYAVIPNYEAFMTGFFKEVVEKKKEEALPSMAEFKGDQKAIVCDGYYYRWSFYFFFFFCLSVLFFFWFKKYMSGGIVLIREFVFFKRQLACMRLV